MATIIVDNDGSMDENLLPAALSATGGGTLTVTEDGILLASGATPKAIDLGGSWAVTINGIVSSAVDTGITFDSASKLTLGETGSIYAANLAVSTDGNPVTVTNAGLIESAGWAAVQVGAGSTIKNSGTIVRGASTRALIELGGSLSGLGKQTVTNSGTLRAVGGGGSDDAIKSNPGSSDTLTNTGSIYGAVDLGDGKNTITNSRLITGTVTTGAGDDKITNAATGDMRDLASGDGKDAVTNSGFMWIAELGLGDDKMTNSGHMRSVDLGDGINSFLNTGEVYGLPGEGVLGGKDADTVTNGGKILGSIDLKDGANKLINTGSIGIDVLLGKDADVVTNSGAISGKVALGDGINTLTSTGSIGGDIEGGKDADTVTLSGAFANDVLLGAGGDRLVLTGAATVAGIIDMGAGDDNFTGGTGVDNFRDTDGSDTANLGNGNDTYLASGATADGIDTIDGGAGIDDYGVGPSFNAVVINLGTTDFTHSSFLGTIAKSKATGTDIGTDTVLNVENAYGGEGHDTIVGSAVANLLYGSSGGDTLFGLAGNDTLVGGTGGGKDRLYGGLGADALWGGDYGADGTFDAFIYESFLESTVAVGGRDTIMDFDAGIDVVDLSRIADHNTKVAGNQDFTWRGLNSPFTGAGGELRYVHAGSNLTVLYGDTNGDKKADFAISFNGNLTLSATDFIL